MFMGVSRHKEASLPPTILCSIVSHAQPKLLARLLADLEALALGDNVRFVVTENTVSSKSLALAKQSRLANTGRLKTIQNQSHLGFGANHNQAFQRASTLFPDFEPQAFIVLNPDLRITQDVINALGSRIAADPSIGILAPEVFTSEGVLDDSARYTPSVRRIVRKALFNDRGMFPRTADQPYEPDIISGMCLAFNVSGYRTLGGFDERYFMYYEDADICVRARASGYRVVMEPALSVIHDAQRQSHRDLRMTLVHIKSMARFFMRNS
jgi:N-acetylglucosaminyl-diphospho-decaprenol L-rhamnosyltransferase